MYMYAQTLSKTYQIARELNLVLTCTLSIRVDGQVKLEKTVTDMYMYIQVI